MWNIKIKIKGRKDIKFEPMTYNPCGEVGLHPSYPTGYRRSALTNIYTQNSVFDTENINKRLSELLTENQFDIMKSKQIMYNTIITKLMSLKN